MSMDSYINLLKEHFNISEEELEDDFNDFDDTTDTSSTEPDDDDCIVSSNGWKLSVSCGGKHIGTFTEDEDAWDAVKKWREVNQYWPNIWFISDHGNAMLVDDSGNEIREIKELNDTPSGGGSDVGNMSPQNIHDYILKYLNGIDGLNDIKDSAEFPNRYGDDVSGFSAKYDVKDRYNYTKLSFNIDYSSKRVFIPDKGYFAFSDEDDIVRILSDKFGNVIKESNDTSCGGEFNIPGAFQHTNPTASDKKKNNSIATSSTGYSVVESYYNRMRVVASKLDRDLEKLSEGSYKEWASDDSTTTRQKINSVIHEVNRKLYEVETIVRRAYKLKSEGDMGQDVYLKGTLPKITKIGERLLKISNIIREMGK